jgi:nitrite reductase/ring-hydroxylating ferredoxin subunit/uncharacterized membrane protein
MIEQRIVDTVAKQAWLNPPSQALQQAVAKTYQAGGATGQRIANFLHGTWLGVPLHPVLTDVPVGAWTVALVLDTLDTLRGDDKYADGADAAITIGLVGAVGAAAAGLTDWHQTHGRPLRLGFVHGVMNISAALLYSLALTLRKRGARGAGKGIALGAYSLAGLSAHLGGDLVYQDQIGVTHAEPVEEPLEYTAVMAESELPQGEPRNVTVGERTVMLVRQDGQVYALDARCSHLGGPLAEGKLEDGSVQCPWHGSRFALRDGRILQGPAAIPQPCFKTRVRNEQIEVQAGQS